MNDQPIHLGAELLRRGEVVAFPTETVYGLGADATNSQAVQKIFTIKGRPSTNPLIVHVADIATARRFACQWADLAEKLAQQFWPGPLTLVVPKSPEIADEVTAGLDTVGLRVPNHPIALCLLREFGGAVAAPSANRSTRISPTRAHHVRDEFGDAIPLIIDGGDCQVGIESTVLDLTAEPRILRPGGISRLMIENTIGIPVAEQVLFQDKGAAASPGQMSVHYAPRRPAYRVETADLFAARAWMQSRPDIALLDVRERRPEDYARTLYDRLRAADANTEIILIEMPPDYPEWTAVRDRLMRATKPWKLSDLPK